MKPLTEDEWNMLDYFWQEKGDLTRWCGWEKFVAENPTHPIVEAWARRVSAEETVTLILRGSRP